MTPRSTPDAGIGARIRSRRLTRGWSVRFAASRAGVSHATWSRIERGLQAADNRFTLAAIARALECSPAELAGSPVPAADLQTLAALAGVDAVRQALIDIDLSESADRVAPPLDELARTAELAEALLHTCDYAAVVRLLPPLLRDLHAETAGPEPVRALRLLCGAASTASSVLRNLGLPADAWLAAERAREAADGAGDPVLQGYAAYGRAGAAVSAGSFQRALTMAERAADDLSRHVARPGGAEVLGSLHLMCALASQCTSRLDDSRAWSAQAAVLAGRTGETDALGLFFGPTNVDIWRISIEVEDGDPGLATEIARRVSPGVLPVGLRQVFLYADTARALTKLRDRDRDAVRLLLTAERIAPQHVHRSAEVLEAVRTLLERSRTSNGGAELRALNERMQLA
ncbi:helix-turn-helix domain-containing protein [Paractinoplanes lichenicola]|uniref:Helix-turn-helix transcriptional regulator n=1 Tax=Paractinoplanes lichenicola TaxID=2802976 RepID=A0ABS1W3F7_9ACTN|nr:helix-turn-helix transcriptional regulator [Actinoplanes lichenicola]MBL7261093.1 helix-turn-helix transcriptional regulator [Actinoplanes lichenicola]